MESSRELDHPLFESAFSSLRDIVFILDSAGELLWVNDRAVEVTVFERQELLAESPEKLFAPEDRETIKECIDRALSNGQSQSEAHLRTPGGMRPFEFRAKRFHDEDGEISGIAGVGREISARREREQELQELEQFNRELVENTPVGLFRIDEEFRITYQNPRAEEIIDIPAADRESAFVGEDVRALPVIEENGLTERIERLAAGESVEFELSFETFQHNTVHLSVQAVPLGESRPFEGAIFMLNDITEQAEHRQTLAALHEAAQSIGSASEPPAVYDTVIQTARQVLDFDFVTIDVEEDGYLVQEAWTIEIEDGEYYDRSSLEDDDTYATRAYNQQRTFLIDDLRESDITPADPKYRSALTVPIGEYGTFQAGSSKVSGFDERDQEFTELLADHARVKLSELEDKRELKARTAQLRRQNEQLDDFASVVSHDLRNPLNALQLSLDLAERTGEGEHFERCYDALDRMETLLEELLTLARNGQEISDREAVSLDSVVKEAWQTVDTQAATLGVDVSKTVSADRQRLKQLFENLFRNAVEHAGTDVTVSVGGLEDGFYVADDGPGIPPEDRKEVFETGYSTSSDGTGFGLAITERIVQAHGWSVDIGQSADEGARFEIRTEQ